MAHPTVAGITCICSLRCKSTFRFTHLSPQPGHILISWWDKYRIYLILSLHVSTPCLNVHRNRITLPVQEDTSKLHLCSGDPQGIGPEPIPEYPSILSVNQVFLTVLEQCCKNSTYSNIFTRSSYNNLNQTLRVRSAQPL